MTIRPLLELSAVEFDPMRLQTSTETNIAQALLPLLQWYGPISPKTSLKTLVGLLGAM